MGNRELLYILYYNLLHFTLVVFFWFDPDLLGGFAELGWFAHFLCSPRSKAASAHNKKHRSHRCGGASGFSPIWLRSSADSTLQDQLPNQLLSWLVVQWCYDVFWLCNECCNGFSKFYGQSGSKPCTIVQTLTSMSIHGKPLHLLTLLFPTPTTFEVKHRGVARHSLITFIAHEGVLAPEQIEFNLSNFHHPLLQGPGLPTWLNV